MTKADLIDEVSRLAELTRKDSEVIVETIFDSVVRSLRAGDKIEIRGFGSFRTRQRKPRVGRNPKTGERVEVPAKKIPFFKPSKELKDSGQRFGGGGNSGGASRFYASDGVVRILVFMEDTSLATSLLFLDAILIATAALRAADSRWRLSPHSTSTRYGLVFRYRSATFSATSGLMSARLASTMIVRLSSGKR